MTLLDGTAQTIADAFGPLVGVEELYAGGARVYDALVEGDVSEIAEMIACTRGLRGDVLDLGCGSGRLTLPFLLRGHRVTAVDASTAMLERLRARALELPPRLRERLELVEADMAELDLAPRRFDAVLLGTTTVTLLSPEQRARVLRGVRGHLAPGGVFLVSTVDVREEDERIRVVPIAGEDGGTALVTMIERPDPRAGVRHVSLLVQEPAGSMRLLWSRPRLVPEATLAAELAEAGFVVAERMELDGHGDARQAVLLRCEA